MGDRIKQNKKKGKLLKEVGRSRKSTILFAAYLDDFFLKKARKIQLKLRDCFEWHAKISNKRLIGPISLVTHHIIPTAYKIRQSISAPASSFMQQCEDVKLGQIHLRSLFIHATIKPQPCFE